MKRLLHKIKKMMGMHGEVCIDGYCMPVKLVKKAAKGGKKKSKKKKRR